MKQPDRAAIDSAALDLAKALQQIRDQGGHITALARIFDWNLDPASAEAAAAETRRLHAQVHVTDSLLVDEAAVTERDQLIRELATQGARLTLSSAKMVGLSAVHVFVHSVLDDTAMRCCRAIARIDPPAARSWFKRKQVDIELAAADDVGQRLSELVQGWVEKFERESLIYKVERIQQVCGAVNPQIGPPGFALRLEILAAADRARHAAVHELQLAAWDTSMADYMLLVAEYLVLKVAAKYDLAISP